MQAMTAAEVAQFSSPTGRPRSEEHQVIAALKAGAGVKLTCRWQPHDKVYQICGGIKMAYCAAKKSGFKVHAKCKDGMLWVVRGS